LLAIVAAIIMFMLIAPVRVHGDNMSPALNDGDVVIILKSSYHDNNPPKYGDVLCFRESFAPEDMRGGDREYRFARVTGLPGDGMETRANGVYRNGDMVAAPDADGGSAGTGLRTLESEEVFVLNDNAADALDSRNDGIKATLGDARGKVVFRIWPLDRFGKVQSSEQDDKGNK
jgi:signal peptidase I